jgi:hypothetical protein
MEPGNNKLPTNGQNIKPFNFLEGNSDIPENMTGTLMDDLADANNS